MNWKIDKTASCKLPGKKYQIYTQSSIIKELQ